MSEKNVQMVALMGGKMTSVGFCSPGQARILQKQGMAEWKDGKIWLRNTAQPPVAAEANLPSPEKTVQALKAWQAEAKAEYAKELAAIDPEGLCKREFPDPETILHKDMSEFLADLFQRREQGHELVWYDDPRSRQLGFLDYQTNEWIKIGITTLKTTWLEGFHVEGADINMLRSAFTTPEGRESLAGDSPADRFYSLSGEQIPEEECLAAAGVDSLPDLWLTAPASHPCNVDLNEDMGWRSRLQWFHQDSPDERQLRAAKWNHFLWPEDKETIPVYRPDEKGDLQPFPPDGENDNVWGLYVRIGEHLLRAWFPEGDKKPTWDISFMRLLEPGGLIYVLMDSKPIEDIPLLLEMEAEFRAKRDKQG